MSSRTTRAPSREAELDDWRKTSNIPIVVMETLLLPAPAVFLSEGEESSPAHRQHPSVGKFTVSSQ